jgi:hypothetical protein
MTASFPRTGVMSDGLAGAESDADGLADALVDAAESWAGGEPSRFEHPASVSSVTQSVAIEVSAPFGVVSAVCCMVKLLSCGMGEASRQSDTETFRHIYARTLHIDGMIGQCCTRLASLAVRPASRARGDELRERNRPAAS